MLIFGHNKDEEEKSAGRGRDKEKSTPIKLEKNSTKNNGA